MDWKTRTYQRDGEQQHSYRWSEETEDGFPKDLQAYDYVLGWFD